MEVLKLPEVYCFWRLHQNLVFGLLLVGFFVAGKVHAVEKEYAVKAAFLFNLSQFVEWPEAEVRKAGDVFIIGIWGEDPFGGVLEALVEGQRIHGRPVEVRHLTELKEVGKCQILFVVGTEPRGLELIAAEAVEHGVLTVGEDAFAQHLGMVGLVRSGNNVDLEINLTEARRAGLTMSSRLLRLARLVPAEQTE